MSNKEDSYKIPSISSLQQEKSIKVKSKNDIFNIVYRNRIDTSKGFIK